MDVLRALEPLRVKFEDRLARSLPGLCDVDGTLPPPALVEAMGYSLLATGKRLRPLLTLVCARAVGKGSDDECFELALPAALALEYVHTYSLIHDDLPALDDDALRRGRPTLHVARGESTAILAGDALLTDAFALVTRATHRAAEQALELALAAGSAGMVGGQHDDVQSEGKALDAAALAQIHARKTGRLFVCAASSGGLAVDADAATIATLRQFGARFGVAFQIADDVLDVIGDVERGGKGLHRDLKQEKATWVRLFGLERARERALAEAQAAVDLVTPLGARADMLVELARFAADRLH